MEPRNFKIEVVLSAIGGVLLCKMDEVYEVLNFLTRDDLFTHQLPRAGKVCRMPVFNQHPFLKEIQLDHINSENVWDELAAIKAKYPNEILLTPIENWHSINPIEEAVQMMGGEDKVIVVNPMNK